MCCRRDRKDGGGGGGGGALKRNDGGAWWGWDRSYDRGNGSENSRSDSYNLSESRNWKNGKWNLKQKCK